MIPRRSTTKYKGMLSDVSKAVLSGSLLYGDSIQEFEKEFSIYIGVKYALAISSGREGMMIILRNIGMKKGDEIIVPSYTLEDLVIMLKGAGYIPKFVDIGDDYNISFSNIKKAVTKRTRAILATHLFGLPCDIDEITGFAKRNKICVIEDCAHSLGAEYRGKKCGSFGDAAFFSFETRKIINTYGGGMIATSNKELFDKCLKDFEKYKPSLKQIVFKISSFCFESISLRPFIWKFISRVLHSPKRRRLIVRLYKKMHKSSRNNRYAYSNVQAIAGLKQLRTINTILDRRISIANYYDGTLPRKMIPKKSKNKKHIYYCYIARVNDAEKVSKCLLKRGIDTGFGDDILQNCSKSKTTQNIVNQILEIPMSLDLNKFQLDYICKNIRACKNENGQ